MSIARLPSIRFIVPIVLAIAAAIQTTVQAQSRLYVNANLAPGGVGYPTWNDAFGGTLGLKAALEFALNNPEVTEVWVATGLYKPALADSAVSFPVRGGLSLYGGFAGTERTLEECANDFEQTILSGDLNGNDNEADYSGYDENSNTVVYCFGNNVINGFRITHGFRDSGAFNTEIPVAVACPVNVPVYLINCVVDFNRGGDYRPVVYFGSDQAPAVIENCIFRNNRCDGVICTSYQLHVLDSEISNNTGAAVFHKTTMSGTALWTIERCFIADNSRFLPTDSYGGLVQSINHPLDMVNVVDSRFDGNDAIGMLLRNGTIVNCVITNHNVGVGQLNVPNVNINILASTIAHNTSYGANVGPLGSVCASIIWDNGPPEGPHDYNSQLQALESQVSNSCVEGIPVPNASGNIAQDPLFIDRKNGLYTLQNGSPCIDQVPLDACSDNYPDYDFNGIPRDVGGGGISTPGEMGAYAYEYCSRDDEGTRRWKYPEDGNFSECVKWNISPPTQEWPVEFNQPGTYTISFSTDEDSLNLNVIQGNVTLDLYGVDYQLHAIDGLYVGTIPSFMPTLAIQSSAPQSGSVSAINAFVAHAANGSADLHVSSGGVLDVDQRLSVGYAGSGVLDITSGGHVICRNAEIGYLATSFGGVSVGDGGIFDVVFSLDINRGVLHVDEGGVVRAGFPNLFPGIFLFDDGTITGNGEIIADVINFGDIDLLPGEFFEIDGRYIQVGQSPLLGSNSGRLTMNIDSSGVSSTLYVTGQATLGGGLFINLDPGAVLPENSPPLDILTATSINPNNPNFDVAYLPALPGKFMKVNYPGGGALNSPGGIGGGNDEGIDGSSSFGPGGTITLTVQNLDTILGFNSPDAPDVPGSPTAAVVGDFNSDSLDDLAITITNGPSQAGDLLVFLSSGGGAFQTAQQYQTGAQPSAITVGQFNAGSALDIAVASREDGIGFGSVRVFGNNGTGTLFSPTGSDVQVGINPSSIAAGDFRNLGTDDLMVANTDSDSVSHLQNDGSGGTGP